MRRSSAVTIRVDPATYEWWLNHFGWLDVTTLYRLLL